jgi:lipopolysaccharide/colanic/teichoic acid biosynthesis glycosyltransferase
MHAYAEYLQDYVLKINGYAETGKPKDDFRLTPWGKILRRYWLDELPQLINVLKGELKLVGVRPISQRYFQDIPPDLQSMRLKFKPGCIPPYVALNRSSSLESVLQAEREYLIEKTKNPYFTDTKFFFKALYNVIFKRKRSA